MNIAVVVLTHNRLDLLKQCVERVLRRASDETQEIIIWNNGSTDGTQEYLTSLDDPHVRVVHHPENIGQNAYAKAFRMTTAAYMIEVDDDIVDAPKDWDRTLLEAFKALPHIGYLAANLVHNPNDSTSRAMYTTFASMYRIEEVNGVRLKRGPVGGGCTMTSREIHDRVGGFPEDPRRVFFFEAAAYIKKIKRNGYEAAYLEDLKVLHKGGTHYSTLPARQAFFEERQRRISRKNAVKRVLLRVPPVRALNDRFNLFQLWPPGTK